MPEITLPSKKAQYSDLFERLSDAAFLLETETFSIIDANSTAERMLNLDRQKLMGRHLTEWIDEAEKKGLYKAFRMAERRYYPHCIEINYNGPKQKTLRIELSVCSLELNDQTRAIQLIARDITLQTEAEQKEKDYLKSLQELNQKLEELSTTDEMTSLPNFRSFKKQLEFEHERAKRYGSPYSIIFCDVDNFKHYNDRNGHPAGDQFLRELGKLLKKYCRNTDLAARYGGEEFAVLCPETGEADAVVLAERLRKEVASFPFEHAEAQPLGRASISVGVASFQSKDQSSADVLEAADQSVYSSKKNGRNRTTAHSKLKTRD